MNAKGGRSQAPCFFIFTFGTAEGGHPPPQFHAEQALRGLRAQAASRRLARPRGATIRASGHSRLSRADSCPPDPPPVRFGPSGPKSRQLLLATAVLGFKPPPLAVVCQNLFSISRIPRSSRIGLWPMGHRGSNQASALWSRRCPIGRSRFGRRASFVLRGCLFRQPRLSRLF